MVNFVIYARESSDDTTKAPSINEQIERGRLWGEQLGYNLLDIYADDGWSGGDNKRPEWNRLMADAPNRAIDIVWVFNQDRIARNVGHFRLFYDSMHESKITVMTPSGEIKMETVGDMASNTAQAMAHEIFRLNTSEKVKSVYESKKRQAEEKGESVKWGRSPVPIFLIVAAQNLKALDPTMSCRAIAEYLPAYELKLRPGETKAREKKVSHTWVAWALKQRPSS